MENTVLWPSQHLCHGATNNHQLHWFCNYNGARECQLMESEKHSRASELAVGATGKWLSCCVNKSQNGDHSLRHLRSWGSPGLPSSEPNVLSRTTSLAVSLVPPANANTQNLEVGKTLHAPTSCHILLKINQEHLQHIRAKDGIRRLPSKGLGFRLSLRIAGRVMMLPDAVPPVDTRTLVPSSRNL